MLPCARIRNLCIQPISRCCFYRTVEQFLLYQNIFYELLNFPNEPIHRRAVCVLQGYKPRLLKVRPSQETPTITHVSYTVGGGNTAKEWAAIKQEEKEEETPTSNNNNSHAHSKIDARIWCQDGSMSRWESKLLK